MPCSSSGLCYNEIDMLTEFIFKKLETARYKLLEDGTYFGAIPALKGVWANAKTLEACRKELREVLEDWLLLQIRDRRSISGLHFRVDKRHLVKHAA